MLHQILTEALRAWAIVFLTAMIIGGTLFLIRRGK